MYTATENYVWSNVVNSDSGCEHCFHKRRRTRHSVTRTTATCLNARWERLLLSRSGYLDFLNLFLFYEFSVKYQRLYSAD